MWIQRTLTLSARPRGCHLVTREVLERLPASLAINENADPDVRDDLERHLNVMVPENAPYYAHTLEGPDDMPAHIKSVLIGPSLSVPISRGRLALGTWQGIYLCEHRDQGGGRRLVATVQGE